MALDKRFLLKDLRLRSFKFQKIKHRKFLILGIVVIIAGIAAAAASVLPLQGRVLTIHPQNFSKGFTEEGTILPAQEFPLYNPVEGKVQTLFIHNGDPVKKGQELMEMNTGDLNYQLQSLKAQLTSLEGQRLRSNPYNAQIEQQKLIISQAEKDAQFQEENLSKLKSLLDIGAISKSQYDEAQRNSERAKNFLAQQQQGLELMNEQKDGSGTEMYYTGQENALQAQIDQVQDKITKAKVLAPEDGIVKDLSLQEGSLIPLGLPLLTVFQNQGFKVESYVLASDALDIKPGSAVEVVQNTGSGKNLLSGTVKTVAPAAVEKISPLGLKENRVKVTLSLQETSPLVLGSSVDVKFTTVLMPNKILVPKSAVFPYQQGSAVWKIKNGRTVVQPVQKGLENDQDIMIAQGLSDGDSILLDIDLKNLKEGKRIKASSP